MAQLVPSQMRRPDQGRGATAAEGLGLNHGVSGGPFPSRLCRGSSPSCIVGCTIQQSPALRSPAAFTASRSWKHVRNMLHRGDIPHPWADHFVFTRISRLHWALSGVWTCFIVLLGHRGTVRSRTVTRLRVLQSAPDFSETGLHQKTLQPHKDDPVPSLAVRTQNAGCKQES